MLLHATVQIMCAHNMCAEKKLKPLVGSCNGTYYVYVQHVCADMWFVRLDLFNDIIS